MQSQRTKTDPDERVFTFVRPAPETEKIAGTAGYERYTFFEEGMTVREFLETPGVLPGNTPRRVDVTYNLKPRPTQKSPNLELSYPDELKARAAREKYEARRLK